MQEIKDLFKDLVDVPTQVITGKVKEVDEANMLCVVEPDEEGADYNNVRLRAQDNEKDSGVIEVPKVGSSVAIARLYNDSDTFFVILRSEVEKIVVKGEKLSFVMNIENDAGVELNFDSNKVKIKISGDDIEVDAQGEIKFNGGSNGGIVKAADLAAHLQNIQTFFTQIVTFLNVHIHTASGSPTSTPATPFTPVTPPGLPSLENSRVKH